MALNIAQRPLSVFTDSSQGMFPVGPWGERETNEKGNVDHGATAMNHLQAAVYNVADAINPLSASTRFVGALTRPDAFAGTAIGFIFLPATLGYDLIGLAPIPSPLGISLPLDVYVQGAIMVGNLEEAARHALLAGVDAIMGN